MSKSLSLKIKSILRQGFLHIFTTTVLSKVIAMLTNVIVVRTLTNEEYGNFSYAYNIVTTVIAFSSLGTTLALLQYGLEVKDEEKRLSVEKLLIIIGFLSNVVFSIGTLLYALFIPLSMPEGKTMLIVLSFLPLIQFIFTIISTELRIEQKNKLYALITIVQSLAYFVGACLGAYLFKTIGTTFGRYFGYIVPIFLGLFLIWNQLSKLKKATVEKEYKGPIKYSFWVLLNNASSAVFYHLDVLIIGMIIADATILADYKVATQIPVALTIIPVAICTFIYPKFVDHKDDFRWLRNNFFKVQLCLGLFNALISVICIIFAPFIIRLFYGDRYANAVGIFRLLIVSFFISGTFRTYVGHVMSMLHEVKANFYIGLGACALNIVGDYFMIKHFGSVGAAYATISVVVFESIALMVYFLIRLSKTKKEGLLS